MRIALVTPEFHSLVRRTNLAHVAEALARALSSGAEVRVCLPLCAEAREAMPRAKSMGHVEVPDGEEQRSVEVFEADSNGLTLFLYDEPQLFAGRHPYGDENGLYPDNWRRYAVFARAVLESLDLSGFEADVLHCMDWTTGLIPLYHRLHYSGEGRAAARAGTFFAIHNLAMQGAFEREILPYIGVPHSWFRNINGIEHAGKVNFLKAGAELATVIGTHSPSHAQKIQERDRGYGLEETFQRRKKELVGITNGIDYHAWNPNDDPLLPAAFSASDRDLVGKRKCKAALQTTLRLDSGPRTPIACMLGRWDADSGFDLVAEIFTHVLERNVELVLMGSGSDEISQRVKTIESSFPGRCKVIDGFRPGSAHLIMGGADFLLLPSHYQPSSPLFAIGMRYGVVPIVYAHGGLEDSVVDHGADPKRSTGFHFSSYTTEGLLDAVVAATKVYRDSAAWKSLVARCLAQDFSWDHTAAEYLKAYRRVTRRVRGRRKKSA